MNKRNIQKELSLPAVMGPNGDVPWEKKGGHSGARTVERVRCAAAIAGWGQVQATDTSSQTGTRRTSVWLQDPKDEFTVLKLETFYGQTASDNRFSITFSRT